jgi:hypothetical protein
LYEHEKRYAGVHPGQAAAPMRLFYVELLSGLAAGQFGLGFHGMGLGG